MDMKKIVEERLYNLEKDEAALSRMREEVQSLREECDAIRAASTDGNPVSGGGNGRSEWLDNNIEQRGFLELRIKAIETKVSSTKAALEMLTEEQRKILDAFFIHRMSKPEEYLEAVMNMDRSSVFRKRNRAMRDLTRLLYGGAEI